MSDEQTQTQTMRPYSQRELTHLREKLHTNLRLGKMIAYHDKCSHFYYVRQNGKKEKEMIENNTNNVGNCSVCWNLNKTPISQREEISTLVDDYSTYLYHEPRYLTLNLVELEKDFYQWLYTDKTKKSSRKKNTDLLEKSVE